MLTQGKPDNGYYKECGVDWLTLTTYSLEAVNELFYIHTGRRDMSGIADKGQFRNYRGVIAHHALFASGRQGEATHYLVKASGSAAHDLAVSLANCLLWESFTATRIDFQVTAPGDLDGLSVRDSIARIQAANHRGRPAKITTILGKTDTVYIGSRSSDRLVRIYQKLGDGAEIPDAVRFEVELKGDLAKIALADIMSGRVRVCDRLAWEWNRLPIDRNHDSLAMITSTLAASKAVEIGAPIRRKPATMVWLETTVSSAINKLAVDHDNQQDLLELIYSWLELVTTD